MNRKGFTLIELLIVIGLLGALTALVLPTLSADREDAIGDVCDYNQAGTVRALHQFKQLTGFYPSDMHNGLDGVSSTAEAMEGLPEAQLDHMITNIATTRHALTAGQATSLTEAGITSICSGTGLNSTAVAEDVVVSCASDGTNYWLDDSDPAEEMTFDGVAISDYCDSTAGDIVVALWITPTTDWANTANANKDWTNGNFELGIDMEGQCPVPNAAASGEEVSFAYYMAYFQVFGDGSAAKMIGSTCPECGVLNP